MWGPASASPLHGRSVRGWVVEDDVATPDGRRPPPAQVVARAGDRPPTSWSWPSGRRGAGRDPRRSSCARRRPPRRAGAAAPAARTRRRLATGRSDGAAVDWARCSRAVPRASTVLRLPPTTDLIDLVLVGRRGPGRRAPGEAASLVLVPSTGWAERLSARLVRRGCPATTAWDAGPGRLARRGREPGRCLGTRAAAGRRGRAGRARRVLPRGERPDLQRGGCAGRAGPPAGRSRASSPHRSRRSRWPRRRGSGRWRSRRPGSGPGWPTLERVDRRGADPRTGMFSEEFVRLARAVLDDPAPWRTRAAGLRLQPHRWGPAAGVPPLRRAGPLHALRCGGGAAARRRCCAARAAARRAPRRVRRLRPPAHEDVAGRREPPARGAGGAARRRGGRGGRSSRGPVPSPVLPAAPGLVGTEAVLHRVRRAAAVAFLDIDLHLLAPRLSAHRGDVGALGAGGPAGRARGRGAAWARVQVQTRVPDHPVLRAVARGSRRRC